MKFFVFALILSFGAPAFARTALICRSLGDVNGWKTYTTDEPLRFTAYVESDTALSKAEVSGAYDSDVRELEADPKYKPASKRYANYNRFGVLEDAWNWFVPLLPKGFSKEKGSFRGYVQIIGEEGFQETVSMNCFLRR